MLTFYTHLNARLCLEIKDLSLSTDLSLAAAWLAVHTAGFNDFFLFAHWAPSTPYACPVGMWSDLNLFL